MRNLNTLDLSQHSAITTANKVAKIITPLTTTFRIKHFRYLKLYTNGSRIILSNYQDCTRFIYELGHYKQMWFDGEFPEHLIEGWHVWDVTRTIKCGGEITPFEKDINQQLGLYHGVTFIVKDIGFYEIYTFDTEHTDIYLVDYKLLSQFILYFKEQARKLIEQSEREKIHIPIKPALFEQKADANQANISEFLSNIRVNRYYLSGKYSGVYLTAKEAQCVYWLIQGKTAEEISIIESNSKRTVEIHLDNIRKKLNCTKQTQIVRTLLEIGFLDHMQLLN